MFLCIWHHTLPIATLYPSGLTSHDGSPPAQQNFSELLQFQQSPVASLLWNPRFQTSRKPAPPTRAEPCLCFCPSGDGGDARLKTDRSASVQNKTAFLFLTNRSGFKSSEFATGVSSDGCVLLRYQRRAVGVEAWDGTWQLAISY